MLYVNTLQSFSCLRAVQFCTRLTGSHAVSWGCGQICDTRPQPQFLHFYIPFTVGQSHVLV